MESHSKLMNKYAKSMRNIKNINEMIDQNKIYELDFSGYPSIIIYLAYMKSNYNAEENELIDKILNILLNKLSKQESINSSFYYGILGVYTSLKFVSERNSRYIQVYKNVEKLFVDVTEISINRNISSFSNGIKTDNYDLIHGFSTNLYFLLKISNEKYDFLTKKLIDFLILLFDSEEEVYLIRPQNYKNKKWQKTYPSGYSDVGMAHGVAAILSVLTEALSFNYRVKKIDEIISKLIDLYISNKKLDEDSGIYYWSPRIRPCSSSEEETGGNLTLNLSWCYGTTGIYTTLHKVGRLRKDQRLINFVKLYFDNLSFKILKGEVQMESPTFCHGLSSILVSLVVFNKSNPSKLYQSAIKVLYKEILKHQIFNYDFIFKNFDYLNNTHIKKRQRDLSILSGSTGVILALDSVFSGDLSWSESFLFMGNEVH